jgi:threonine/homoserine/homoserine lactone efflux protein
LGFQKIFIAAFVLALSGAMMPGPLLTVTIAQTAKRGFIASVLIVAGHAILELLLVSGLVLGLGNMLRTRTVMCAVAVVGGAMLLWMGWGMLRDGWRGSVDIGDIARDGEGPAVLERSGLSLIRLVGAGIGVSISNPYWLLWWATVGVSGLTLSRGIAGSPLTAIAGFFFGHISGDVIWYLAVGIAVATGRRLLSPTVYRGIIGICGIFLLFLGGSFIYLVACGGIWKMNLALTSIKF